MSDFDWNVMSQKEARALGLSRYYDGSHCKHGHFCQRYSSNGQCCRCMTINLRKHKANLTPAQKEKNLEARCEYRKNNAAEINARRRAGYAKLTKAELKAKREKDRQYRADHKEAINARRRARRAELSEAELEVERAKDRARRRPPRKRKGGE